jgi:hypothetical protein
MSWVLSFSVQLLKGNPRCIKLSFETRSSTTQEYNGPNRFHSYFAQASYAITKPSHLYFIMDDSLTIVPRRIARQDGIASLTYDTERRGIAVKFA